MKIDRSKAKRGVIWGILIILLAVAFHIGMQKNKDSLCSDDSRAYAGCKNWNGNGNGDN